MYLEAPEVEKLAEEVLTKHEEHLQDCYGAKIKYLFKNTKKSAYSGKCCRTTGFWRTLTNYDFVIWVHRPSWDFSDENSKKALLYHELRHIKKEIDEETDEVIWGLYKHEAEIFINEIQLYGPWTPAWRKILTTCRGVE
jgi:hypothetical protein